MKSALLKHAIQLDTMRPSLYREKRFEEVEHGLQQLLALAANPEEVWHIKSLLISHYYFLNDDNRSLQLIDEHLKQGGAVLQALIALAEHYHYYQIDVKKAACAIEKALVEALTLGSQVRQVLGIRIRIALLNEDYRLVEDSLKQLVEYKLQKNALDVAFETDFVEAISIAEVSQDLVRQYKGILAR